MLKFIKYLVIALVLVVIVVFGLIMTVDVNQYKPDIVQLVKDTTKRDFEIKGDLKLTPSLTPTIKVNDVTFGNASWGEKKPMLSVGRFEAQVALMPLLKKDVQVKKLILIKPEILLETDSKGNGNWVIETASESKESSDSTPTALPTMNVSEILIKDANLVYKNGKTGKVTELVVEQIKAQSSGKNSPLNLTVKANLNDAPVEINGTLGSLDALLADKEFPVDITAMLDKASLSAEGKLAKPKSVKGLDLNIDFSVDKLSDLSRLAGSELADAGPIEVTGKLKDVKGGYSISGMTAKVLNYDVSGDVTISTAGERPAITATLNTDTLDLSEFTQSDGKSEKKDKVFSSEPLPLEGLKAADVNLKFKANQLITSSLSLDKVNLNMKLQNGKLNISPFSGNVAGGSISTKLDLDASNGKTAKLTKEVTIKQIELGQLPQFKEKESLIGGKTDATIKITGSGANVAEIMAGSNGQILVNTGSGKLLNDTIDVAGADVVFSALNMMNPLAKKEKHTTLECSVIKFDIKDGIATTDRGVAIQTTKMNIVGSGTLNFKTEEVAMAVKPQAREGLGIGLGSLVDAVSIGGTLAEPSPKVDTATALKTGATVGAAVATGGLSLLAEGLFKKTTADGNPCDTALGKAPAAQPVETQAAETKTDPVEEKKEAVEQKVDDVKEKTEDKIKNALEGFF